MLSVGTVEMIPVKCSIEIHIIGRERPNPADVSPYRSDGNNYTAQSSVRRNQEVNSKRDRPATATKLKF